MNKILDFLKIISRKLPKLEINIEDINLDLIKNLRTNLLDTSDERHSNYTLYSMIDVLIITILSDCDE